MKEKKLHKRHIIVIVAAIVIFIVLCCVYIERVKKVNGLVSKTYTISYKMGETVEFGDDILINYPMTGYSIRVNEADVIDYEKFFVCHSSSSSSASSFPRGYPQGRSMTSARFSLTRRSRRGKCSWSRSIRRSVT